MEKSDRLRLKEVRAVYRLLGECRELGREPAAWRQHMLEGLRALVHAQVGLYLQLNDVLTANERIVDALDVGFIEPSHRALWARYQRENAQRDDLFHQRYYRRFTGVLRTRSLESVVDMAEWRRSRHCNDYVRACGLDDRITSSLRLPDPQSHALHVVVLHRSAGDGLYPRHAVRLVHLFHQELCQLIGRQLALTTPGPEVASLPSQLRRVLACLMQGDAEKQIASRLGISRHTVSRHLQRLYGRFGVHSRGELMFRCRDLMALLPDVDAS
jgi:ATP/maltotriose-dependent transcriptional regulator MalT